MIKAKSPQFWQYYAVIGALAILNVLASSTVFFFTSANQLNDFIPPLRLSLGLNLAALTLLGPTLVPGVWLGEFLFTRGLHLPLLTCLAIACGMALQAWLGAKLLRWHQMQPTLARLHDVASLVLLGALLSTPVSTLMGVAGLCEGSVIPWSGFGLYFGQWWIADVLAVLLITPVILTWASPKPLWLQLKPEATRQLLNRRRTEIGLWLLLLFGISWLVLTARSALPPQSASQGSLVLFPLEYLLFPLVVWSALRFGQRGTTLASLLICGIAFWGLAEGDSPFLDSSDPTQAVLALQAFISIVGVTGLFLAAAMAERHQAIAQLQDLTRTLDQQVYDRTQQLQESEARARRLVDSNLIGVAFWDSAGNITEANQAFYQLLGHSADAPSVLNWQDVLPPQHRTPEAIAALLQPTTRPIEQELYCADHQSIPVLIGATLLEGAGVSFILDLSERKRAQEALQESERRFRRLAESNIFGVAFGDFNGGLHYVNDYLLTLLGCDREELLSGQQCWFELTPSDFWPLDIRGGEELRRNGVCTPYQKELIRKDGTRVPILIGATLLQAPYDQQQEIIAFCVDLTSQKQAEAALRQSQAEVAALNQDLERRINELQALFEVIPIGIAIAHDSEGRHVQVNSAFAQLLGVSPEENAATPLESDSQPPFRVYRNGCELSATEMPLQYAAAHATELRDVEIDVVRRDGQTFNLYGHAAPLLDEHQRSRGGVSAFVNITERKRTEAKIAQLLVLEQSARSEAEAAQRQLANLFETSPVGLGFLDRQQRFVAINEALAEINGLSPEAHLGRSIAELFGETDPGIVEVFKRIYETGKPFIAPNYAVNVPGRSDRRPGYYNVYYVPEILPSGEVEHLLVYVLDVTERVRLEQRETFLANASSILSTSLDYKATLDRLANLAVPELADWCTVDTLEADGEIRRLAVAHVDPAQVDWAKQLQQHYEFDPQAEFGVSHVLRTGQAEIYTQVPADLLANTPPSLDLLRQVKVNSAMIVPLIVGGKPLGAISLIAAESKRPYSAIDLRLAEELAHRAAQAVENARLYHQAQEVNRVKDEFLATLSHELRSPLNGILGWAQFLRRGKANDSTRDRALETIERNAKAQVQLIDDLLDISRIIRGKLRLEMRPIELVSIVQTAIEAMRPAAAVKGIQIDAQLEPSLVSGDPDRLQQILWNLLSNAIKFTPNGGRVEVRLEQVIEGKGEGGIGFPSPARLEPLTATPVAQISVIDTGKGIHPNFLPHVFERFRQADSSITRSYGGLGLGLAIVRHLIELHGGSVQANSSGEGQGATFTVRLPLLAAMGTKAIAEIPAIEDNSSTAEPPRLDAVRVLIVDDEADARELVSTVLQSQGAEVAIASSVSEALAQLAAFQPQVLVSDIGMPREDGYSLMRQVRSLPLEQGGRIPAVALTAYARAEDRRRALMVGFQSHVAKPVNPTELVIVVASLAGRTG